MRPWHDDVIVVMAPPKPPLRCFYNSIIRETLSTVDKERLSWTGNLLCLSSSLQSEICPDLGGVTRYALNGLLQVIEGEGEAGGGEGNREGESREREREIGETERREGWRERLTAAAVAIA